MLGWGNRRNQLAAGNPEDMEPPIVTERVDTRRIALALGGGAARGWAHIGVLRALDEAGVKIGMIAGTSIGALVGGCYLAGKLDELEEFARSLTMRRIAGLLDLTIGGGGLFGGMRLTKRMQEHLEGLRVENLDHPFIAVATELRTGHEVWIHQGDLVTALRSSYALPGIFEPVQCNGRTLIDGALVNPVPVSVCRAYEQALVVAVNLNYDLFGRSAVVKHAASPHAGSAPPMESAPRPGLPGVMVQAFNIIQDRISRSRLAGDPPDLMLHPRINDIGLSEFHRASEAIDRGYQETRARIPELERMQQAFRR
ncbi:patatin-like phospholipase family protein [Agrobacterium genomosp. 3]|uniref:Patatin-like phospholipase family protein n=2 Tax=Agrobacterium tumefaciens complex TaxID=1183400 RepID=A0AAE6EJX3_AGRTU|nr:MULTISPECIES: patatin-like phospholipase family protein [Rhizobium/Agrobacterium group]MCA1868035.1 patatin-like phospholipase family protein [Agrobacterium tomkonis]MCA2379060.1 patatin-like phospholipase family protein [Agrobacterium tomkonis RTP8]KNY32827.1 Patatin [Agrobacterium sp. SUL3]KRA63555.1 Patatin [Rhizobium sp. Root651]MBP8939362.1 patatin-like phospholipase family protein [Agrobacterium sp.]